jgi:Flp pilus assembly protein TadD
MGGPRFGFALLLLCVATASASDANINKRRGDSTSLPITTSSVRARVLFQEAMKNIEYLRVADALDDLRSAVRKDPKFASGLIFISYLTKQPDEQTAARNRAKQLAGQVTPGERLLIRWLGGVQEDDYVPAIAAMNDLLASYPHDPRVAYLAGSWLVRQERYPQAAMILERAVSLSPNYPAAINELGYAYAFSGDFPKAFDMMERYTALQPDQPNPHDSYGELLRLDGKFDAALEHYRMAIRIDPNFGSELGVADTYALMGREEDAREEYAKAVMFAKNDDDRVTYELQSATTWIREGNRKQAEHSLQEAAKHAHAVGIARLEAEAHLIAAMIEPDYKNSMKQLQAAENALTDKRQISKSDLNEEKARILRIRAERQADAGSVEAATDVVGKLAVMASQSRDEQIQIAYHAAAGAVLMAQNNCAEAIPHLEEDSADPASMQRLTRAYLATGAKAEAHALELRLASLNIPTVEQAVVVPAFRAAMVGQSNEPPEVSKH